MRAGQTPSCHLPHFGTASPSNSDRVVRKSSEMDSSQHKWSKCLPQMQKLRPLQQVSRQERRKASSRRTTVGTVDELLDRGRAPGACYRVTNMLWLFIQRAGAGMPLTLWTVNLTVMSLDGFPCAYAGPSLSRNILHPSAQGSLPQPNKTLHSLSTV